MVAPTGVNEGTPREPETTERPGPATAATTQAEAVAEAPAGAVSAELVPPEAGQAAAEQAEAEQAEAEQAEAGPVAAEPAVAEPAVVEPAVAEPAVAEPAGAEPAGAGPAGAGPAGGDVPGPENQGGEDRAADESRDVGPLALVGIVVGVIALVGVAAGVLAMVTHGFKPKTVVSYRPAAVFGLRPGQCVNAGANSLSFTVVSCASPHDAEVFARFSLPAAAWPGSAAVRQEAGEACASKLDGYLNPKFATIGLTQEYVYPNREAWAADQRTVVCEVSAGSGRLTGSVRATS